MVAEDMAFFPYTNNLIKKYPKQSKKFIIAGTGTHRRTAVQRTATSRFCMHECMFFADPIGHTANPCMVVYVYLDYQLCIELACFCKSKVATRTIQLLQLFQVATKFRIN